MEEKKKEIEKVKTFAQQILALAVEQGLTFSELSIALKEIERIRYKRLSKLPLKSIVNQNEKEQNQVGLTPKEIISQEVAEAINDIISTKEREQNHEQK